MHKLAGSSSPVFSSLVSIETERFAGKFSYAGSQPGTTELQHIRQDVQREVTLLIEVHRAQHPAEVVPHNNSQTKILKLGAGWLPHPEWTDVLDIMAMEVCKRIGKGQVVVLYPEDHSETKGALLIFAALTKRIFGVDLADTMSSVQKKHKIPSDIEEYCEARKIVLQYKWNLASQHLPTIHTFLT